MKHSSQPALRWGLALYAVINCVSAQAAPIRLISIAANGSPSNNESYNPGWHPSGCCVVFYTQATNLFAATPPNPQATQIALANLKTGLVTNLAPGTPVNQASAINPYTCTTCKSPPMFSADGTKLVFYAEAANGLDPADTDAFIDIFLENLPSGKITRLTGPKGLLPNAPSYVPLITRGGHTAAFGTLATNLLPGVSYRPNALFAVNLTTKALTLVSVTTGTTSQNGGIAEPAFSPNGAQFAYGSNATDLAPVPPGSTNIFIRSISGGPASVASTTAAGIVGNGLSTHPSWSADGSKLLFQSDATSLGGDGMTLQVYLKNLTSGTLTLISTTASGTPGNAGSNHAEFSPDGTKVVMDTVATNFAVNTAAGTNQVVVKNLLSGAMSLVSVNTQGVPSNGNSNHPHWSPDGTQITFGSTASDLVANDTNNKQDIFVALAP